MNGLITYFIIIGILYIVGRLYMSLIDHFKMAYNRDIKILVTTGEYEIALEAFVDLKRDLEKKEDKYNKLLKHPKASLKSKLNCGKKIEMIQLEIDKLDRKINSYTKDIKKYDGQYDYDEDCGLVRKYSLFAISIFASIFQCLCSCC